MKGYTGRILFVDLTNKEICEEALEEQTARWFLGGPGLGAYYIFRDMPGKADVFGPESVVGFVNGACVGTGACYANRLYVCSKSPVTGGWNDCNLGGLLGTEMKKAGFDAIFVRGISETPVYIHIKEGKVSLKDASEIWGKTISETEKYLSEQLEIKNLHAVIIGPAGENLSYMSAIIGDGHRAAARGGSGAVIGSKKLKAIVFEGDAQVDVFDQQKIGDLNKIAGAMAKESPFAKGFSALGTNGGFSQLLLSGSANVKNWAGSELDYPVDELEPMTIAVTDPQYKVRKYSCRNCLIQCGAFYDLKDDSPYGIKDTTRPEYETYSSFATALMCKDKHTIYYANQMCNEYGLDTISCGTTIAWAMECYEKGYLTKEDLDGIELEWGSDKAIKDIIDKICLNEGCGQILKLGTWHACKAFGKGDECMALAGKMEIGQHDPRREVGNGRVYAYDPTPGRHMRGGLGGRYREQTFNEPGFSDVYGAAMNENTQNGGFCLFGNAAVPPTQFMEYINAVTGFGYDAQSYYFLGVRSWLMRQAFNIREGQRRKDWTISGRLVGKPPMSEGVNKGRISNAKKMGDNFFNAMGCNLKTGVPTMGMLQLTGGLDMVIRDLYEEK
ncbi:MAG: hypothetical protein IJM53_04665 [Lachnospiraceae bacterium]|nr:hypothetical protein [Lachnospiraceae bacterium]